jgi:hypothetical protein
MLTFIVAIITVLMLASHYRGRGSLLDLASWDL